MSYINSHYKYSQSKISYIAFRAVAAILILTAVLGADSAKAISSQIIGESSLSLPLKNNSTSNVSKVYQNTSQTVDMNTGALSLESGPLVSGNSNMQSVDAVVKDQKTTFHGLAAAPLSGNLINYSQGVTGADDTSPVNITTMPDAIK